MAQIEIAILGEAQAGKSQMLHCIFLGKALDSCRVKRATLHYVPQSSSNLEDDAPLWNFVVQNKATSFNHIGIYCVDLSKRLKHDNIQRDILEYTQANPLSALIVVGTKSDQCYEGAAKKKLNEIRNKLLEINVTLKQERCIITSAQNAASCKTDGGAPRLIDVIERISAAIHEQTKRSQRETANFTNATNTLSLATRKKIQLEIGKLKKTVDNVAASVEEKIRAIDSFATNCELILEGKHPKIMNALKTIATIAAITLLTLALGFGIGLLTGVWISPASFISGLVSGNAATNALVGVSGLVGVLVGSGLRSHSLFKVNNAMSALNQYVEEIKQEKTVTL